MQVVFVRPPPVGAPRQEIVDYLEKVRGFGEDVQLRAAIVADAERLLALHDELAAPEAQD